MKLDRIAALTFILSTLLLCGVAANYKVEPYTPNLVMRVCKDYNIPCKFERIYTPNGVPNAYISGSEPTIYIKNDMDKLLTKSEMDSIIFHELGHIVFEHHKRMQEAQELSKLKKNRLLNQYEWCHLKRQMEYESDAFTVQIAQRYGVPSHLDEAFQKFIPQSRWKEEACTHPSTERRVKRIKQLEQRYEIKLK